MKHVFVLVYVELDVAFSIRRRFLSSLRLLSRLRKSFYLGKTRRVATFLFKIDQEKTDRAKIDKTTARFQKVYDLVG